MKNTLYTLLFIAVSIFFTANLYAQDEKSDPVMETFSCTSLIDNQTVAMPYEHGLELIIQHRLGQIKDIQDLYGIYAPSNIRLGFNYGLTENLMVQTGLEKNNKLQDFGLKWRVLRQTEENEMPVTVSLYGSMAIDERGKEVFGMYYSAINRFSYFGQIIIARKFGERLSLQVAPSFSHFNAVEYNYRHDMIGLHAGGRYKFYNEMSFFAEYDHSFGVNPASYYRLEPTPNYAFGLDIATGTHVFQVFASTYDAINPQKNYVFNDTDLSGEDNFLIGFNITVRF